MDLECSINVAVTLIAACTALITGFHVVNFFTINHKLHKIRKMQMEIEEQIGKQRNVTQEYICIANGLEIWNHCDNPLTRGSKAFLEFHHALLFSIELEREDYDWLFDYLDKCIKALSYNDFDNREVIDNNQKQRVRTGISEFTKLIDEDTVILKRSKNYFRIKHQYETMRKNLSEELKKIATMI